MLTRLLTFFLCALVLCGLLLSSAEADTGTEVRGHFAYFFRNQAYPSGEAACTALLQTQSPPETLKGGGKPDEYLNVPCQGTRPDGSDGFDQNMTAVSYELICPDGSTEDNSPERTRNDPMRCQCQSPLVAISGAKCGTVKEAASHTSNSTVRTKEELLATPQNRDPEGCGLGKDQQRAIAAILGKPLSSIPQLNDAWQKAVKDEDASAVAQLESNESTNKKNRQKYFSNTRVRFWKNVYDDKSSDGALELVKRAGATIPKRGNAATMVINGKNQTFDVDHLVGLAEDPTKMISVDNLQLSPAKENRLALEEIARVDAFYDPQKWLQEQAEKAKKTSCSIVSPQ